MVPVLNYLLIGKYTKYYLIFLVYSYYTYTILYKYAGSANRQLPNQINIITPVTVLLEVFFLNGKTTARYLKQTKKLQKLYGYVRIYNMDQNGFWWMKMGILCVDNSECKYRQRWCSTVINQQKYWKVW